MNGSGYRALAAVLAALPTADREAVVAARPDIDRARLDDAVACFEFEFARRAWPTLADREVIEELMQRARPSAEIVPIDAAAAEPEAPPTDFVALLGDDVDLPEKAKQTFNSLLAARGAEEAGA